MEEIIALFGTGYLQIIGLLVGIDIIFGVVGAIIKKDFAFRNLGMFMHKQIVSYILGFAVLQLYIKSFAGSLDWILFVAFVLILLALLGSIFKNLGKMGLPLPGTLKK